jgi:photosystem II stability/assembly factor-like uncharacterized protein
MRVTRAAKTAVLFATTAVGATSIVARALAQGPQLSPPLFKDLKWRSIGPAIFGGRILDIEVARIRGQPDQLYLIAENGGVFKSVNGGLSWAPVFDGVNSMMSMGDIAISNSSPNTVWVGTGSGLNPTYFWGEGVYKSTDGAATWTNMGLKETRQIGRIVVHPTNPDVVYVAASGRMWGPNADRGLYKTTDGGRTWKKMLYVNDATGATDVAMDPSNPEILYATMYQRQRKGYGGNGIGPGSAIYKTVDGGEHWTKLTNGLPRVDMGRIGLTISPVDPKVVYADVEVGGAVYSGPAGEPGDCPPESRSANAVRGQFDAGEGGIYLTTDGGDSWTHVYNRSDQPVGSFVQIRADPKDRNRVYREGTGFYVSEDMGKTFRSINTNLHGDYRSLWIDPDDPNHMLIGNDGGLGITWDRTATWDYRNNIPIGEYWELSVDRRDPYLVCGGLQDNGIWCIPSAVRNRNGISNRDAFAVGGGDGMFFQIDPRDTNYAFIEVNSATTANSIDRLSLSSLQRQAARPGMVRPASCLAITRDGGRAGRFVGTDSSYRWAWNTPIIFSATTPGVVYSAGNVLFKSTDRGGSWKAISPDLTSRVNRDTIFIMGKAVGTVNYSPGGGPASNPEASALFGSITWIGESPMNGRILYTGSDDGQVQVTRDGGATWTNVTKNIAGLPPFTFVSSVVPSAHVAGRVYATFDGHFNDDEHTYVFVSDDYGQHWRSIINGLPTTSVHRIAEDPRDANVLVIGDARGVHFSNDAGATWQSLATNMPTIPTRSVVFEPRTNALVVGTYARGAWILDDVSPLETLTPTGRQTPALLVGVTRGRQWNLSSLGPTYGVGEFYAPNPEFDPVISYYVRDGAQGSSTIAISDGGGRVVRTLRGPAAQGLNRVTWDMHMTSALTPADVGTAGDPAVEGGRGGRGGGGGGGRGRGGRGAGGELGPLVLPGKYSVAITIPGIPQPLRGSVTVEADPIDAGFTAAERRDRQELLLSVHELQRSLAGARRAAQTLGGQADVIRQKLGQAGAAGAATADSIADRLVRSQAEADRLIGITSTLMRSIEGFNDVATADHRQQLAWAREDAANAVTVLNRLSQTDLPRAYAKYAPNATPPVVAPLPAPPPAAARAAPKP